MSESCSPINDINVEWTKEPLHIRDFIREFDGPQIVKIHEGENKRLQIPGNFDLQQPILLYKVYTCRKIHGRSLVMDNQWQIKPAGPTLIIPDSYPGWVAIVKRDGRTAGHFSSVGEVARASLDMFLAQDALFGLKISPLGMRRILIPSGTVLKVAGAFEDSNRQSYVDRFKGYVHPDIMMYLKCVGQRGEVVFLPYSTKGRFYCISTPECHTLNHVYLVSNLLRIAPPPTLIRIVSGPRPRVAPPFTNIVKLEEVRRETILMGCAMAGGEPVLLEINANSEFSFLRACSETSARKTMAYRRMSELCATEGDRWRQQIRVAHHVVPQPPPPSRAVTPSSLTAVSTRSSRLTLPACETIDFVKYAYRDLSFPRRFWMFRRSKRSEKSHDAASLKSRDDASLKSEHKFRSSSRIPMDFFRSYYLKYKEKRGEPFKHCRDSLRLRSSKRFRADYPRISSSDDGYATSYLDDESIYHSIC